MGMIQGECSACLASGGSPPNCENGPILKCSVRELCVIYLSSNYLAGHEHINIYREIDP